MYKKLLLFFTVLFLITGCDATYNLEINGDEYKEDVTVLENNQANFYSGDYPAKEYLDYNLKYPISLDSNFVTYSESTEKVDGVDYYEVKDVSDNDTVGINLKGKFNSDLFERSNMVVSNYNRFVKATIDGNMVLSTGERLKAFDQYSTLNSVTINIKTNNKVVKHNADEVKGTTYTWYVDRSNYIDKSVYLEFKEQKKSTNKEEKSSIFNSTILIIVLAIVIAGCIIALFIFIKNRKNNKL